jgi:hypothetical protein
MASKPNYEEVLRYIVEATGDQDIAALARQILTLDNVSEEARESTARLLQGFADAQALERSAKAFRSLGTEITEVQGRYTGIQSRIRDLTTEMAAVDEPTRRQEQELKKLSRQLSEAGSELLSLRDKWSEQRETLELAGVATQRYGTIAGQVEDIQRRLAAGIKDHAKGLLETQQAQERAADYTNRLNDNLEEQGRVTHDVAADLKEYERGARQAGKETKDFAEQAQQSTSILDKLRTAASAVFAYFTVDRLIDGIKGIVTEGSKGEQELGQLEAALASTGRQAEYTADQLEAMAASMDRGMFDAGDITSAQTRLLSYTNIVGEQFPQALQISIDQAQRLGISIESSAELIGRALQTPSKAMEALGRQGFVLENSQKQLIKELEATGRTAEAQAIIMDLLVESYGGAAAAARTNKILGLWEQLRETWRDWQQDVANRGVLNYFKDQIRQILDSTAQLSEDGTLGRWAQQTSDAIVRLSEIVKGSIAFLIQHRDAIVFAAKAYAAFKIGAAIVQMNQWRVGLMAATDALVRQNTVVTEAGKRAVGFGRILRGLPTNVQVAIGLIGVEVASLAINKLFESLDKYSEGAEALRAVEEKMHATWTKSAAESSEAARALEGYAHVQAQTAEQVLNLGEQEREGYRKRIEGLKAYLHQLDQYYLKMSLAGALTPDMASQWDEVKARVTAVNKALAELANLSDAAARGLERGIPAAAQLIADKLEGIGSNAKLAATSIRELFDGLNFADTPALGNVGLALADIAAQGAAADRNVRQGLLETISQLSGEELLRFQSASQAAFAEFNTAPKQAAAVLDSTLYAAMERLGVSTARNGMRFSEMGRDAIAAFGAILENANATSQQIETAFRAALDKVATVDEVKTLGSLLRSAGEQGAVGFDQTARAMQLVDARLRSITAAVDPLVDEFALLGIQSQASLNAAKDAAYDAFDAIRRGAASGKASVEDVRRAFDAYSRTARDSVAASNEAARERVESELAVMDAVINSGRALDEMGAKGGAAAEAVSAGADAASSALDSVAASASNAAGAVSSVGSSVAGAGGQLNEGAKAAQGMAFGIGQVGEAFWDTWREMSRSMEVGSNPIRKLAELLKTVSSQRKELRAFSEELARTAQGYDVLSERRTELQERFTFAGKDEIEAVLQQEQEIDGLRKARNEKYLQEQEQARQRDLERLKTATQLDQMASKSLERSESVREGDDAIRIEFVPPSNTQVSNLTKVLNDLADIVVKLATPKIIQAVSRAKASSNRSAR